MKLVRSELIVLYETLMQVVLLLPRFRLTNWLKARYMRAFGAKIGRRPVLYSGIWIMPLRGLTLGDDVDLARGTLITTGGTVTIGDRTLIGYGARILSANHRRTSQGVFGTGHEFAAVRIGSDVWIGAGATVLPGVEIGDRAVVAAGAVVTRAVPAGVLVAGVPARPVNVSDDRTEVERG